MSIKLYKHDLSPAARTAMMGCDVFNVPVELVDTNLLNGDHLTPEFLKKNPLHTIPVLEDDDLIVHDSHAIIMYLADKYGKTDALYPKDVKRRARVNQILFFESSVLSIRLTNVTYAMFTANSKTISEKQKSDINEAYGFLEEFLSRSKFLAGNEITIADISSIAIVSTLIHMVPLDADKYVKLQAWMKHMESQPYCKKYNEAGALALGDIIKNTLTG